jgi:hypothetical protein
VCVCVCLFGDEEHYDIEGWGCRRHVVRVSVSSPES